MSEQEIDDYLAGVEQPKRATLEALRASLIRLLPEAEQGLSYGAPAFKVGGKAVAGFAAHKGHLTYMPHSGSVISELGDDLSGYETSKGALTFPVDRPLPEALVEKLVAARKRELGLS